MSVSFVEPIPAGRLSPLVNAYLDRFRSDRDPHAVGAYRTLAERAGVSTKTLQRIANVTRPRVDTDTADRVVTALDRSYLWHIPADQGGLADLYDLLDTQLELDLDLDVLVLVAA